MYYELDYCVVALLQIVIAVAAITTVVVFQSIVVVLSFVVALVYTTCLEFAFVATICTADRHSMTNKTV